MLIGVPVAFVFGIGAVATVMTGGGELGYLLPTAFWQTSGFTLLALPLFIMMGNLMDAGGITESLIAPLRRLVRRFKGGSGTVTIVACSLFGAISGSGSAAIVTIGKIMVPEMLRSGYSRGEAAAIVATSAIIELLIPPSIPMLIFAMTAKISVASAFLSTLIPGALLAGLMIAVNRYRARNNVPVEDVATADIQATEQAIRPRTRSSLPALLLPLLVLGGIYSGIFTPTEAAALAMALTFPIGFLFYRMLTVRRAVDAMASGVETAGAIIACLFFLFMFSRAMVLEQVPEQILSFLLLISDNPVVVLLLINVMLVILGMLLDDISGAIIAAIILMPVAVKVGVDPIHFSAIVGTNLGMGNITPPTAPFLYMAGTIAGARLPEFIGPTLAYMIFCQVPVVLIVTYVPFVSMALPNLIVG
jgi:tripartite ATP-independent transporter DctM subunit